MSTVGPRGALPALVTPLTPEREVDDRGIEVLVQRASEDGASGVLVAGSTGEGALLEPAQRVQVTRRARLVLGDDGTVLAGASGPTVESLVADVDRLATAGASAVLVLAPATYPLSSEELVDLHVTVAERCGVPTLVYHLPDYTGSTLTVDGVRELAGHPHVVGLKDSSSDGERRAGFVAATRPVAGFAVLTGHAPSLAGALTAGAAGSITAIANLRQRQVVALHAAVASGDDDETARLQGALAATWDALQGVGGSVPAVLKAALQLEGTVTERWCRPPLASVPPARLDRVRTALLLRAPTASHTDR